MSNLKTEITKRGQHYVDEPVYVHPRQPDIMAYYVNIALNPKAPPKMPKSILVGYKRLLLNWVKPNEF